MAALRSMQHAKRITLHGDPHLHHKPYVFAHSLSHVASPPRKALSPPPFFSHHSQNHSSFRPSHILLEAVLGSASHLKDLHLSPMNTCIMFSFPLGHLKLLPSIWLHNVLFLTKIFIYSATLCKFTENRKEF